MTRLSTRINEDTDLRLGERSDRAMHKLYNTHLKHLADGIEEPAVRVDLLLILCLDNEDDGHRDEVSMIITVRENELWRRINGKLGRVL